MSNPINDDPDPITTLHQAVDRATRPLDDLHRDRLQCRRGCASCCVDDLTVFPVEADLIRRHHAPLLATGAPHPEGSCAFLDDQGACRIYEHRPYVCRTQGYPLRWLDEADEGDSLIELRDICPLNDVTGPPIEELPSEACWTLGPVEEQLAQLQHQAHGEVSARVRVRLRDLFTRQSGTP
ncbi:YkgJ family cysteine cluster protein [Tautonia marina]|uniref:YkgJ family cysteine cluster protein n=1 Tax=Tautonia marina TaxID=2653855 RepID=UPI001260FE25|nr:YkgJ family cysteine cluster protein [Tautonia marina]